MTILFTNNAASTLASGIDGVATSLTLADGSEFPSPTGGNVFYMTLTQAGNETSWEVVQVTARTGNTLTVVRAQDGTAAASWSAGAKAELRLSSVTMNEFAQKTDIKTVNGNSLIGTGNLTIPTGATFTQYDFTATAGQTTFSATYTPSLVEVFMNGLKLPPSDYTASNGTSVVLTQAAALNDVVTIVAYGSFDVANTYTQAQTDALLAAKQVTLVSGTTIKTINGASILGAGNLEVSLSQVKTPTITSPADGATGVKFVPLYGSTFHSLYGFAFQASQFQLATDSGFTANLQDSGSLAGVTSWMPGSLSTSTTYYARVRYQDSDGVWSQWSVASQFATSSSFMPATEQARLQYSDAFANDNLGNSCVLSSDGNTLVAGSIGDDESGGYAKGSACVFTRSGSTWSQQAKIQPAGVNYDHRVGHAVAVSSDGDTVAISAPGDSESFYFSGAVYVFTRSGSTWTQQAKLKASDAAAYDALGDSVALSSDGNTLAVGAANDSNSSVANNGSVYIFTRSGSAWTQQARVNASDVEELASFGESVALNSDGNTLAVGSPYDNGAMDADMGSAYIFTRSGSTWTQQAKVVATGGAMDDRLGDSVALSADGNTLAVGAGYRDAGAVADAGAVYVFTRSGSTWSQQARLDAGDQSASDIFGRSVSISSNGNLLAISSDFDDNSGGTNAGSVYLFSRSGSTWTQQSRLQAGDAAASDRFGASVALSADGGTLAVGASMDDNSGGTNSGSVYVFA